MIFHFQFVITHVVMFFLVLSYLLSSCPTLLLSKKLTFENTTLPCPLESRMWSICHFGSNSPSAFWSLSAFWILNLQNLLVPMLLVSLRLPIKKNKIGTLAPFWTINFKLSMIRDYFNCIKISLLFSIFKNRTLIASGVLICPRNAMNMIWTIIMCIFHLTSNYLNTDVDGLIYYNVIVSVGLAGLRKENHHA